MEQYNLDELVPPSWLDDDFITMVLRKYHNDNTVVLENLKISPGTEKGDHFASIMFRVLATYVSASNTTSTSISMIVKTIPEEEGFKKEVLDQTLYFETEIGMYSEEIPKLENELRQHGDDTKFGSKILYYSLEPRKVIVFEDLVALGYTCIRDRYLNVDEVKLCLSKIAKWHAASYKLSSESGDISTRTYQEGLLSRPKNEQPEFITEGLNLLIEAISQMKEFEKYIERLRDIEPLLISKCNDIFRASTRGDNSIMVLNHGDLHNRNVMFKIDNQNKVEDVMLVDMQISCYGPAVIDIFCSIQMLFDMNLRQNHRDEMIQYYFSTFAETLKTIRFARKLPTLDDLYSDMFKYKEFELWLAATLVPLICAIMSQGGNVQTEDLISSKEAQIQMYLNPDFIAELRGMLPRYFSEA